jgi:type IV pilus assembly protein PilQ
VDRTRGGPASGGTALRRPVRAACLALIWLLAGAAQPVARTVSHDPTATETAAAEQLISLSLQDAPLAAALQLLAGFSALNVVLSDRIVGSTTLRLEQVPWEQALTTLLELHDLGQRRDGTVLLIAPLDDLLDREQRERERAEAQAAQQPLLAQVYRVRYARAADLAELINAEGGDLLSKRGRVTADLRTNALILRDTAQQLEELGQLLATLDVAVPQVLIESRIVIARSDFSRELGIRLGASALDERGSGWRVGGTRGGGLADTAIGFQVGGREGLLIDLPATAPTAALGMTLGHLSERILQLELSAMELEGRGEIISSPRVITADQQTASIRQGVDIPYQQSSGDGGTSIAFQEALLSLEVTPQITPDGGIIMRLTVTKDSVGQVFGEIPSIDTQSLSTQVLVRDGATLILGGILEQEHRQADSRVPGLANLPGIGRLFRQERNSRREAELLIFVTPRIMRDP